MYAKGLPRLMCLLKLLGFRGCFLKFCSHPVDSGPRTPPRSAPFSSPQKKIGVKETPELLDYVAAIQRRM